MTGAGDNCVWMRRQVKKVKSTKVAAAARENSIVRVSEKFDAEIAIAVTADRTSLRVDYYALALATASRAICCRVTCESHLAGSVSRTDFIIEALHRKRIVHCREAGNARWR